MAIDIAPLWDFSNPSLSEQRFRDALVGASPQDQVILQTQIARCHGLQADFDGARGVLTEVATKLDQADAEGTTRYWLELGRTYCSTAHPQESQTDAAKAKGRDCYMKAFEAAKEGELDGLAIDALHMMTMVDTAPEDQIEWNLKCLELLEASDQPAAKQWEGSIRNNLGYAYKIGNRLDDALAEFKLSLAAYEKSERVRPIRMAKWMVASTLRGLGKVDEALDMQLKLENEWEADGSPSVYVYQELETLYRAKGDEAAADGYAEKIQRLSA